MFNPREDYKKKIEAIEIIKKVCEHHSSCSHCPYSIGDFKCGIINDTRCAATEGKLVFPKDWEIPPFRAIQKSRKIKENTQ